MDILGIATVNRPKSDGSSKAFSFKEFGRVESAEIERAPFTVICGRNNSGKSYLAYLIWAYYNAQSEVFGSFQSRISAPPWFKQIIDQMPDLPKKHVAMISKKDLQAHLNRWLARNKNSVVKRLLNWDEAEIGAIRFEVNYDIYLSRTKHFPGEWKDNDLKMNGWSISFDEVFPELDREVANRWYGMPLLNHKDIYDRLYIEVLSHAILGKSGISGATYIPASRSGLLLSLGYIAESLFSTLRGGKATQANKFAAPVVNFLRAMVRPGRRSVIQKSAQIADFLEENVLQGAVIRSEEERTIDFSYLPMGSNSSLPVYASSSMVTELTPIIEMLRNGSIAGPLVLEEPEAHLHLSAQRQMARALVRASNQGIPIIVTTHSDTFVQQINFLMMLYKSKNRAKLAKTLKYSNTEFLDPSNVIAYEIVPKGRSSIVNKVSIGDYGIAARSLSDVIMDMSHEVLEVSE